MLASLVRSRPWTSVGIASLLAIILLYTLLPDRKYSGQPISNSFTFAAESGEPILPWQFQTDRDERNLGLSDEQCESAFPEQYAEITRARDFHLSLGGINEDQIRLWRNESDKAHGQLRILIYDGDLYIVGEKQGVVDRTRYLNGAAMIYRAITAVADPRTIPNVEFTLDRMDHPNPSPTRPGRVVWGWTREIGVDNHTWVFPDFNGWATSNWDKVGGYRAFRARTKHTISVAFPEKTPKLLWRGQIDVGRDQVSPVRAALLESSKDHPWSDVRSFRWGDGSDAPVDMEDHCLWQFLAHTEGNSWSGRLRNLVNCNSAIFIHNPLKWVAHFYPVLKSSGPEQNYIAVKNDWSDLREKMEYYLAHPEEAEKIAEQTKRTFRDRYMTPAAEACYIRRMIVEWRKVQNWEPELFVKEGNREGGNGSIGKWSVRGVSWERFAWRPPKEFNVPPFPEGYFFKSDMVDFED